MNNYTVKVHIHNNEKHEIVEIKVRNAQDKRHAKNIAIIKAKNIAMNMFPKAISFSSAHGDVSLTN